ncbi:mitochondrial carrier [Linnemannia elongata AG-77]|uniref:Mitochondrial carrier n=1 Tax=Linnemannia elongata AG-77 TaxID=1314771 RepID=A0A197JGF5_9FUNG|nr:mitochondrial carrier [Linnemannia elongata AG-77]
MAPPKTTISQPQDSHVALSNLLASSTAALASRLCTHPLDTVKTRIQVSNSPHQGLIPTFVELVRTRAVYRGLPIALALSVPGLSVYLTTYDLAKDRLSRQFEGFGTDTVQNHMMSGMIAEVFSGLFWTPMEILKSKQQVENMSSGMYSSTAATGAAGKSASSPTASNVSSSTLPSASSSTTSMIPKYTSTANLARQIYQHEGFLGFYRGYFITLGVFVPYSMIYFAAYEQLKDMAWRKLHSSKQDKRNRLVGPDAQEEHVLPFFAIMGCAAVACGIAAGISNIVDVVKTRWQTSILSTTEDTSSTKRIATQLFRQGGFASFTRGMGARIMWMVPSVTISMSTFEWLKAHGLTGAITS